MHREVWKISVGSLLLPLCLGGCRVSSHKNGTHDDISLGTPFGSMQVKTDDAAVLAGLGLTPYPGAATVHKKNNDDGAADVNMSFGNFKLGVHALELQTADPEDRVLAFYRKDMARYGAVLTCRGSQAIGEPTRTAEGLSCDTDGRHHADDGDVELRAGSGQHQHIVSVETKDGGTHIGLVALELPHGLDLPHGSNLPNGPSRHGVSDREE